MPLSGRKKKSLLEGVQGDVCSLQAVFLMMPKTQLLRSAAFPSEWKVKDLQWPIKPLKICPPLLLWFPKPTNSNNNTFLPCFDYPALFMSIPKYSRGVKKKSAIIDFAYSPTVWSWVTGEGSLLLYMVSVVRVQLGTWGPASRTTLSHSSGCHLEAQLWPSPLRPQWAWLPHSMMSEENWADAVLPFMIQPGSHLVSLVHTCHTPPSGGVTKACPSSRAGHLDPTS